MSAPPGSSSSAVLRHGRALAMVVAAACAALGLHELQAAGREANGWWLLLAAAVLGAAGQLGLAYPAPPLPPPPVPPSRRRRLLGLLLAAAGAALWSAATLRIYRGWVDGFDFAWMGWSSGAALLAVGLDLAWARWPRPAERRWSWPILALIVALVVLAGVYRLGNIRDFPGEAAITQIEDLQVGNFGWAYLRGYRLRWEYLSSTWLAALGLSLGGASQFAVRVPFAAVSALKLLPLFVWLRLMVGTAGALVGTALLTFSFWDVTLSRIPNNHNALIVATVFALIAGPVRRGRPSGYVLLGFFGAYVLHEYIAYRPLAAFAVAAAVLYSLGDRAAGWVARLARPALTAALLLSMVAPLFLTRLPGPMRIEYFDGWNRAKGITGYYNPEDTWAEALERRWARTVSAAQLFAVRGDVSPARNVAGQPPLTDPVTCALLVLGIAGAAANALRPVFGLTLAGFAVTVLGTLVMTGNFDVARVGGAVPYAYALAGIGAAGLLAALGRAWGRVGRAAAVLLLAAGVLGGGWWSTRNLFELWTNPTIRKAHRNNLAYLTIWLGQNTRPDERVLGIAPGLVNVLEPHDGGWLRGRDVAGFVTWDIETALRQWQREPGPTLFFVCAGTSTPEIVAFLEALLPELTFQVDPDPLGALADVAYARLPGPPPDLARRLAEWRCSGVRAEYAILGARPGSVLYEDEGTAPFIEKCTWPAAMLNTLFRLTERPEKIRVRYTGSFAVTTGGPYTFTLQTYAGSATLLIDGQRRDAAGRAPVELVAGLHRLEVDAEFAPMAIEPGIRLIWSGPDSGGRPELMPFYRIATVDPSCAGPEPPPAGATPPSRRYLTAWLGRGPFDARQRGAREDFLDVAALSTAPEPAPGWTPLPVRDAFVDLDAVYAAERAAGEAPHWTCAYAATTVQSPSARTAWLEVAGSDDPMRIWLNGRALTAGPLTVGYTPKRRPVDLRAGANLLVVQSCELIGAWYFVAALTDAAGAEMPDLQYAAALPDAPIPLPPPDTAETSAQLVEGFEAIVRAPHRHDAHRDYRGAAESWWIFGEDADPTVVWRTATVEEKRRTLFAVTASTSFENGAAALLVNGAPVLEIQVGNEAVGATWTAGPYEAAFIAKPHGDDNSGILLVSVPPDAVTPGAPLELGVRLTGGARRAWFMIKAYPDTIAYEQLTGSETDQTRQGPWELVAPPPG